MGALQAAERRHPVGEDWGSSTHSSFLTVACRCSEVPQFELHRLRSPYQCIASADAPGTSSECTPQRKPIRAKPRKDPEIIWIFVTGLIRRAKVKGKCLNTVRHASELDSRLLWSVMVGYMRPLKSRITIKT
ncbi:uncharacterized protein [Physcomitrium patens]|uniref:uncharacterized protein n=1 Tax=Physcomitrium patens TaxID=3218 RepID=UPI003CCD4BDE